MNGPTSTPSAGLSADVRRLYLVRHCHREDLVDGVVSRSWQSSAECPFDPGLSAVGLRQAAALANKLRGEPIQFLISSPFLRTVATAQAIAAALDLPMRVEEGLSEWLNPAWFPHRPALLPLPDLKARFPAVDTVYQSRVKRSFPEPDEQLDAWPAAARTARELLADFPENLLLVGHGATLAGIIHGLTGQLTVDPGFGAVVQLVPCGRGWSLYSHQSVPVG